MLDPVTYTATATLDEVGWNPRDLTVAPTGTQVYVANFGSSTVSVLKTTISVVTAGGLRSLQSLDQQGSPLLQATLRGRTEF